MQTDINPEMTGSYVLKNNQNMMEKLFQKCCFYFHSGNSDANYPADMKESDLSEHFEDAPSSPTTIKQRDSEVSTGKK